MCLKYQNAPHTFITPPPSPTSYAYIAWYYYPCISSLFCQQPTPPMPTTQQCVRVTRWGKGKSVGVTRWGKGKSVGVTRWGKGKGYISWGNRGAHAYPNLVFLRSNLTRSPSAQPHKTLSSLMKAAVVTGSFPIPNVNSCIIKWLQLSLSFPCNCNEVQREGYLLDHHILYVLNTLNDACFMQAKKHMFGLKGDRERMWAVMQSEYHPISTIV